jgi:hypothetical protein
MPEHTYATNNADFKRLCEQGFTEDEAAKLIHMRDHFVERTEYREMVEEQHRLDFMRWMVEHDRISK